MGRMITAPGVLKNVQGQIDHVTDMYDDIKDNNLKPLTITLDPVSNANGAISVTTEDERITEDMKPVTLEVGTPEVFKAPITVTTGAGTATLTCSNATGTSTVIVTFIKTSPVEGGEDYPPAVTSTEFDILADRIGSLSSLDTTNKSDLVSAVNEVNSKITKFPIQSNGTGKEFQTIFNNTRWQNLLFAIIPGNFKGKTVTLTKVLAYYGTTSANITSNSSITRYDSYLVVETSENVAGDMAWVTVTVADA